MKVLRKLLRNFKWVRLLESDNKQLREQLRTCGLAFPPGHFYSPLTTESEVATAYARGDIGDEFAAIEMREEEQMNLLRSFAQHYPKLPFLDNCQNTHRYPINNNSYGSFDVVMLHCMLCHLRPRRIIEVGCGCSSAAMLDINESVFDGQIQLTFIDPDTSRLEPLLRPKDRKQVSLLVKEVQDVPLSVFSELGPNDVLFIDSSHVSKIGSDVNRLFFHILPSLQPGVCIHIHDISAFLDYPADWFAEGRIWNEQYLLRAFLMYNRAFRIELFSAWMRGRHPRFFSENLPLAANSGGGQIWLRKMAVQ
jgi:hypothetical protein